MQTRCLGSRTLTVVLTAFSLLASTPLYAQDDDAEDRRRVGFYKILIGSGIAVTGAIMAGTSGDSGSITFGNTTITGSSRSTSQLVTGLSMVGGGVFLIWNGSEDRKKAQGPSASLNLGLVRGGAGFTFRRSW